jgi:hypothetical protein
MLFCPQQKRTVPERGGAQTYGLAAWLPVCPTDDLVVMSMGIVPLT